MKTQFFSTVYHKKVTTTLYYLIYSPQISPTVPRMCSFKKKKNIYICIKPELYQGACIAFGWHASLVSFTLEWSHNCYFFYENEII